MNDYLAAWAVVGAVPGRLHPARHRGTRRGEIIILYIFMFVATYWQLLHAPASLW
jgi:hypothetical protein